MGESEYTPINGTTSAQPHVKYPHNLYPSEIYQRDQLSKEQVQNYIDQLKKNPNNKEAITEINKILIHGSPDETIPYLDWLKKDGWSGGEDLDLKTGQAIILESGQIIPCSYGHPRAVLRAVENREFNPKTDLFAALEAEAEFLKNGGIFVSDNGLLYANTINDPRLVDAVLFVTARQYKGDNNHELTDFTLMSIDGASFVAKSVNDVIQLMQQPTS